MNEQLQKALTTLLDKSLNAVDFMVAELPEVIQQLLLWKMWEYLICNAAGIILMIVVIVACIKGTKAILKSKEKSDYGMEEMFFIPMSIGAVVFSIMSCSLVNIVWLQILIAPKVYLIEYAASLAK